MENNQNNNFIDTNPEIKYSRLDKEIKREERNHRLKKGKSSKKDLKKKILAWGLGTSIVAGAVAGTTATIIDQTKGDGAYNREIEKKFELVDKTLTAAMKHTPYSYIKNSEITGLYFEEPMDNGVTLKVFYEGEETRAFGTERYDRYADFQAQRADYDNLVEATENNNKLVYLDCLNQLFANMIFIKNSEKTSDITIELPENTIENIDIFNKIFNIDEVKTNDINKQLGFMPYYIEVIDAYTIENPNDEQNPVSTHYTFEIHGLSYCETVSENASFVKPSERLIIGKYDKNRLKSYNRIITFSSYINNPFIFQDTLLTEDIAKIISGENNPYTVSNLYFEDAKLFEDYFVMQGGNFKYKMPEGFNLEEYFNSQEVNIR